MEEYLCASIRIGCKDLLGINALNLSVVLVTKKKKSLRHWPQKLIFKNFFFVAHSESKETEALSPKNLYFFLSTLIFTNQAKRCFTKEGCNLTRNYLLYQPDTLAMDKHSKLWSEKVFAQQHCLITLFLCRWHRSQISQRVCRWQAISALAIICA